jgi:hypothetical protein
MTHNEMPKDTVENEVFDLLEKHVHAEPDGENIKYEFSPLRHELEEDLVEFYTTAYNKGQEDQREIDVAIIRSSGWHTSEKLARLIMPLGEVKWYTERQLKGAQEEAYNKGVEVGREQCVEIVENIDTGFETTFNIGARKMKEQILEALTRIV